MKNTTLIASEMTVRWKSIFGRVVSDEQIIGATGELFAKYSQPNRHYHTLIHINAIHRELDQIGFRLNDEKGVRLACDVHDAIQEPKVGNDEANSLRWMETTLDMFGYNIGVIPALAPCVMATVHAHDKPPENRDAQFFADADIAILGKTPKEYDLYRERVRKEYRWAPDAQYAAGRGKILKEFLGRKRIYWTDYFRDLYEETARDNLAREIALLEQT